jgi:hypothetical protein
MDLAYLTMMRPEDPSELRRRRLGIVLRDLAADVIEQRRRRLVVEREVRELRARVAAHDATDAGSALRPEKVRRQGYVDRPDSRVPRDRHERCCSDADTLRRIGQIREESAGLARSVCVPSRRTGSTGRLARCRV